MNNILEWLTALVQNELKIEPYHEKMTKEQLTHDEMLHLSFLLRNNKIFMHRLVEAVQAHHDALTKL